MTFDKKPGYKEKFDEEMKKRPKLSTFRQPKAAIEAVAMKDEIPLGTVNEEDENDLEHSTQKMTPLIGSTNLSLRDITSPKDAAIRNSLHDLNQL